MEVNNDNGRLIVTPHPVVLDGQRNIACDLQPGETLGAFLARHIDLGADAWEVRIGGVVVDEKLWDHVKPKDGQVIEVRGAVNRNVLSLVAFAALTYFTFGFGAATAGAWGAGAAASAFGGGLAGALFATSIYVAGSMLINKALAPKQPSAPTQDQDSVYSIGAARNTARPYEPVPLLFGSLQVTPDLASAPYTWYEGDEQHLGMVLNCGIGVDSVEAILNDDTDLESYEEVELYYNGFSGMPDDDIPLYSNVDTVTGGELLADATWVQRTTALDTVRILANIEYILGDITNEGKPYYNSETVEVQYRETGTTAWLPLATRNYRNNHYDTKRTTIAAPVASGQYDVRVRRLGEAFEELNGRAQFNFTTMSSVQLDETDYAGLARVGLTIRASGQLNGPLDQLRTVAHSTPIPVWDGTTFNTETSSNPGAQILAYARGIEDQNGRRIAGIGLDDEQIDIPALQAFTLHCAAEGYTYDHYVKRARSHEDVLNAIALAGFGQITWAGGRLSVTWAADEQPLSGVVNMATIKKGEFQVDYTVANSADGVEFTYLDRTDWQTKTLRVPAPGVTTMLNPAQIQGEGVTNEEHAAKLARYHLAQSLFQYKDVSYSTDLEHLSYRRLSTLALQHDLTQWGFGGRVVSAQDVGGVVTVTLDEPVPAPSTGNAFIGLRIPGENVYRVFGIETFSGESDTLTLSEPWPADAAFPGDTVDNPAHDTIWIYDFKQTPGLRVRVVAIEPENNLEGARVSVVPEPPEFWTYVETGEYIPPDEPGQLLTKPVASNLVVSERQNVQGDTVFTELVATFDIEGPMAYATVHAALQVDGTFNELLPVAETRTREAVWRIPSAGIYSIVVRPFNADGVVGGVVSTVYETEGADIPPVNVDFFNVADVGGGVRKYTWGYNPETFKSPNVSGVEIRYVSGHVAGPVWGDMTPLGDDGFYTSAFESVVPQAGDWTMAIRTRNTDGQLAVDPLVIQVTLSSNLAEEIDLIRDDLSQEIADRIAADAAEAQARADADLALAQDIANLEGVINAPFWEPGVAYLEGDMVRHEGVVYVALQDVPADTEPPNATYWEDVGQYDQEIYDQVEANAAAIQTNTTNITNIDDELTVVSNSVDGVIADVEDLETGQAANSSAIDLLQAEVTQNGTDIDSHSQQITALESSIGDMTLCANPSFEYEGDWAGGIGGTGPLPAGVTRYGPTSNPYRGQYGLRYQETGSDNPNVYNRIVFPVAGGDEFDVRCRTRSIGGAPDAGATVRIGVRWRDGDGNGIGTDWLNFLTTDGNAWGHGDGVIGGHAVPPSGAAYGQITMVVTDLFNGGVLFDFVESAKLDVAMATAVSSLDTRVTQAEGEITANASAITSINAEVGDNTANITELFEVSASGTSGNAVVNASFEDAGQRWGGNSDGTGPTPTQSGFFSTNAARTGGITYRFYGRPDGSSPVLMNTALASVNNGQAVRMGFWSRHVGSAPDGYVRLVYRGYDDSGAQTHFATVGVIRPGGGSYDTVWRKFEGTFTVPNDVVRMRVGVQSNCTDAAGDWIVDDVFMEPLSSTDEYAIAKVGLYLDVNGNISGYETLNDGETSEFNVLADVFRIIPPNTTGERIEMANSKIDIYDDTGTLRVELGVGL